MKCNGKKLVAEVDSKIIPPSMVGIWWLGQHSFIVKLGAKIIYIDPFLSDHGKRLIPPLLKPEDITNADLVLGSHDHRDHIDREMWPAISKASPKTLFVVPEFHRTALSSDLDIPLDRFVGMNDGEEKTVSGISISAVASAHEFLARDELSGLYPFLGFVVRGNGITLYHSGDTCNYEGLQTKLSKWKFDVIMLPINGRDAKRLSSGCVGNMTYQEAADLAGALSPGITIPAHFEMFPDNLENPQLFLDYMLVKYPHLKTQLSKHGELVLRGA